MYNFALLSIAYTRLGLGVQVETTSNAICHLTLYWTDKKPWRHHSERLVRGLVVPWGTYFCFVAWHAVEQNEAGDTLTHTFDLPDWNYCETIWFTFRGTVGAEISPSGGPIFEKHNDFFPYTRYEYYIAASNTGIVTNGTIRIAQTFTPLLHHTITQVVLLLSRIGLPGTIIVGIEETTPTGRPDDVILTGGTFNGDDLPPTVPGPPAWITIPIDPFLLTAGTMYAIVLFRGLAGTKIAWDAKDLNPYPRGRAWGWVTGPNRWVAAGTFDLLFEEWGY